MSRCRACPLSACPAPAALLLALVASLMVIPQTHAATTTSVKFCGRKLGDVMSRVCKVYNGPAWDVPIVVDESAPAPVSLVRRRRRSGGGGGGGGIADECCTHGCTYEQLSEYCSVSDNADLLEGMETHLIEDRSAESDGGAGGGGDGAGGVASPPGAMGAVRREVGHATTRGGDRRVRRRRRRCRCRRGRMQRPVWGLTGNMGMMRSAGSAGGVRAAPLVGTVSPLLTWGRTINTDLPQVDRDRYAYVAVYNI